MNWINKYGTGKRTRRRAQQNTPAPSATGERIRQLEKHLAIAEEERFCLAQDHPLFRKRDGLMIRFKFIDDLVNRSFGQVDMCCDQRAPILVLQMESHRHH